MRNIIFFCAVLACGAQCVYGLSCLPCNIVNCTKQNCERSGYALGICGCCNVCAKPVGESCRGIWNILGTCDKNLTCNSTADHIAIESIYPEGICSDAECKAIVDLIFAIDGSRSLTEINFSSVKDWVIEATTALYDRYGACAHIGVVEFATDFPKNFVSPFGLGECTNNPDCYGERLRSNLTRLDLDDAYTYRALQTIVQDYFPESARYNRSQEIIVVVSDEPPLWGPTDRQAWRNISDANGIDTFVVALEFPPAAPFDWSEVLSGRGQSTDTFLPIGNATTQALIQQIWNATVKQTERQCTYPEVYRECSSPCNATCENPDPICITVCDPPRCECVEGYVWRSEDDHTCIPRTTCPNECPEGRPIYCIANACEVEKCPSYPEAECKARCNGCIADFFDRFGNNITDKCKECTFPEVYRECSSPCNATCEEPYPICIERCDPPKCECASGYVRTSGRNATCIPLEQCSVTTCEYPKVYEECPPVCHPTCDNPNPVCPEICGTDHCVCPTDHVFYSETDKRCVYAHECPARTCTRDCPEIHVSDSAACSQQLSADAWICQLSNWRCTTYEWKLSMEEWWHNNDCYTVAGDIEAKWQQLFICEEFTSARCVDPTAYRFEIDAFGCRMSYCAKGVYKDFTQPLEIWQKHFTKYQEMMKIYREASELCSGTSERTLSPGGC